MMSSLKDKLKDFEDFELAFVLYYKGDNYTENTRKKILEEAGKRGLTTSKLKELVDQKLVFEIQNHNYKVCPRCTSTKIIDTREMIRSEMEANDAIIGKPPSYKTNYFCGVCGWDFQEDKTKTERKGAVKWLIILIIIFIIWQLFINIPYFFDRWINKP